MGSKSSGKGKKTKDKDKGKSWYKDTKGKSKGLSKDKGKGKSKDKDKAAEEAAVPRRAHQFRGFTISKAPEARPNAKIGVALPPGPSK